MTPRTRPLALLAPLALGLLASPGADARAANAEDGPRPKERRLRPAQCERLVEQLVNPDRPPFEASFVDELPKGLRMTALARRQAKVKAAYDALSANVEVALPVLVRHADDKRFSYVYQQPTSGVYRKADVGFACREIIGAHVEVYHEQVMRDDETAVPRSLWFIAAGCGGVKQWWEGRKGKPLAELQLEAVEWALRHKKPGHFKSDKEWAKAKGALLEMAKGIRASRKPVRVKHALWFW